MFYNAIEVDCIDNNIITISCLLHDLNCGILTISFSTVIDRGCNNTNSYDATVCCCKCIYISSILIIVATDTIRIWNSNPFPGLIQLQ